ncbi:hypothetical protein [Bdellovibrio sp. BCCA]|uniref:hypothetical protein n=1 Tax=Bdellovibrio sp. BCCA TaxID=3136281 RepID=UPI0030F188C9
MKKYFALLLTLVGSWASAAIHEVNEYERTVYYSLTPYLEMNVMDLESDGGILSVSLAYDGDLARQEMDRVKATYPGYKLNLLTAQVTGAPLKVEIPSVGISEETVLRQGQAGPYMNLQISLKKDQVAKLKTLAKRNDFLNLEIPVQANYSSSTEMEKFEDSVNCSELRVNRIEDLILNLSRMKQPSTMRYDQTFISYKKDLLQKCFETEASSVKSFRDVLNLPIKSRLEPVVVKGLHLDRQNHDIKFNLVPILKVQIN